jgi:hypothetical protein
MIDSVLVQILLRNSSNQRKPVETPQENVNQEAMERALNQESVY